MDMFVYNPAAIPDYVHTVANSSAQLEDVRTQAQTALASVREEFQGSGGMSFEEAQMLINSGIDAGKDVILRHSATRWARMRPQRSRSGADRAALPRRQGRPTVVLASPDTSTAEGR